MAKTVKHRRGTRAQHASFVGAESELTVITDNGSETLVVHTGDGPGVELARNDVVQTALDTKLDDSQLDATVTLGTSDTKIASQNAVKTYVDTENSKYDMKALSYAIALG